MWVLMWLGPPFQRRSVFFYLVLHRLRVKEAGEKVGLKTENGGCIKDKKTSKEWEVEIQFQRVTEHKPQATFLSHAS